jgi:hypothetical protein
MRKILSLYTLLFIIICLLSLFLQFAATREDSVTTDEVVHIYAGYSYLTRHDFRLDPEHPPLLKEIGALPLLFMHLKSPGDALWNDAAPYYTDSWRDTRQLGEDFLYSSGNNFRAIVFWSRVPFIMMSLLLGLFTWFWAKKLYGQKAGLLAAFLILLLPTVLAHGHLANTDVGLTLFMFVAVYFWGEFLTSRRILPLLIAALFAGFAFAAKYTAALLLPILLVLMVARFVIYEKRLRPWKLYLLGLVTVIIIGFIVIWASYCFKTNVPPPPLGGVAAWIAPGRTTGAEPPSQALFATLRPVLFPADYYKGLFMVFSHADTGHPAFLMGEFSNYGWWYYFPTAIFFKTPIAFFFLLILAIIITFRRRASAHAGFSEWLLIAPAVVFLGLSMLSKTNLGVRHVLPIFPFLCVFAAKAFHLLDPAPTPASRSQPKKKKHQPPAKPVRAAGKPSRLPIAGFAVLAVWYLYAAISPGLDYNYIAYFNEFAGGSYGGYRLLGDSNLDWGQDLNRIHKYLVAHRIDKVSEDYNWDGRLSFARYGIDTEPWSPALPSRRYVITCATYMQNPYRPRPQGVSFARITPGVYLFDMGPAYEQNTDTNSAP